MKAYRIRILTQPSRQLRLMSPSLAKQTAEVIVDLNHNPYPPDSEPLARELSGRYRIRIDGWRLIYSVNEEDAVVTVLVLRQRDRNTYLNVP